jgi:hypothetical protein
MTSRRRALLALLALAVSACRGGGDEARVGVSRAEPGASFDWKQPRAALDLDAGEAARRIGSFEWTAQVSWRVHRGDGTRASSATERHRLAQTAEGPFEVESVVDDGRGPGSETGRHVIHVGGTTYAKGRWAPFRERPTDRGRDAERFRDESFRLAGDLAALCGQGLTLVERGETTVLGRPARRYAITLDRNAVGDVTRPPEPAGRATDRDTQLRVELLEGAVPQAIDGELVADAATGVPLRVRLAATLGVPRDGALRAQVTLDARVTAIGAALVVRAPEKPLPDERKPKGVAQALEAAGLKQTPETATERPGSGERAEPPDDAAPTDG